MFDEIEKESIDEREKRILEFWEKEKIFLKTIEQREGNRDFVFYDGPPFATGLPHYGHLLAGTIKDVIPRYRTMKGDYVPRTFGWDCHGLPVENEIEKANNLSGAKSVEEFGIAKFNEECRSIVLRYTEEWKSTVARMGRWVDFDKTWHTLDMNYMESVWWVFQQLYKKGLVYQGYKVMPFSAKLGTPLSNFEAGENYKEVDDPSLTVMFPLADEEKTYFLAWTTTPWTLVSNMALLVSPDLEYAKVYDQVRDQFFILAKDRLEANFDDPENYTVKETFKGDALVGKRYLPLFPYFEGHAEEGAFRIISETEVSAEEGAGVVHCAPAFGEVDFYAAQKEGVPLVCPVDRNGKYTSEIPDFEGMFVKDADKGLIRMLKEQGLVFKQETCHHRYPFCWRSDTPLIYRAMKTWFINVEKIRDKILESNDKVHWTPRHVKVGRFGKWLEGARDWAVSRNRYWGTPIPLWISHEGDVHCVGSIQELEELTGEKITDLHRHYIDHLTFEKEGKTYQRVPEVFDCWFESGSMPYAQRHYPFENEESFKKRFPADFIAEGLDQTRGWFYSLIVLSTALFDQPAYKNVIVNGIILAEDGSKMSKRLKNYPDPMEMVHKYGADAIRLFMLDSPVSKAANLCFSERGVELTLRQVLIPLWNAYSFFVTYARIYQWTPEKQPDRPSNELDKWILSHLNRLIEKVEKGLDNYDLPEAVNPFVEFIDQLTNWYIRRSRRRFWSEEDNEDRRSAFSTLYTVLIELCKVAAPFTPFISDAIYRNLRDRSMPASVHMDDFPVSNPDLRDHRLEKGMKAVQTVVSLGHSLRKENKMKVRQPLPAVLIASGDEELLGLIGEHAEIIAEELNVKKVELVEDEKQFVDLKGKPNFRVLGKKVGKKMPEVQKAVQNLSQKELEILFSGGEVALELVGGPLTVTSEDVEVERHVLEGHAAANEGALTISLDTTITEELKIEALAREIVNKVNTMRRDADLAVTDRIALTIDSTPFVKESFEKHRDYITNEILATSVDFSHCEGTEWDLNGEPATIKIEKSV